MVDWPEPTKSLFARKLGHEPPWTPEELASLRTAIFKRVGRGELPWLELLPNVRGLNVTAWHAPRLQSLTGVPQLRRLRLWDCTDVDLTPLPDVAPNLQHVELKRCYLDDLSPLLDLPKLHSVNLDGLPMSEDSWQRVVPALLERGIQHVGNYPMMADDEWQVMHALQQRGLTLSVYRGAWGNAGIKAVGDDAHPTIVFHRIENLAAAVDAFPGKTLDALWAHLQDASDREPEPPEAADD